MAEAEFEGLKACSPKLEKAPKAELALPLEPLRASERIEDPARRRLRFILASPRNKQVVRTVNRLDQGDYAIVRRVRDYDPAMSLLTNSVGQAAHICPTQGIDPLNGC